MQRVIVSLSVNCSFNNNIFNFNLKDDNVKQDLIWLDRVFQNFGPVIGIWKRRSVIVCENKWHSFDDERNDYVHLSLEKNNYQNHQENND